MQHPTMLGDWSFNDFGREVTGAVSALIGYEPCPKERNAWRAHVDLLVHCDHPGLLWAKSENIARQASAYVRQGYLEHNAKHPDQKVRDMYILVNVTDRSDTQ